jgi:hypothetical protein
MPFDPSGWASGGSPAASPAKSKCPLPSILSWACALLQSASSSKPPHRHRILPDPVGRHGTSHEVSRPFSVSPLAAAASMAGFASPVRLRPQVFSTSRRVSIRREPAGLVSCRIRSWGSALQSFSPPAWPCVVSDAGPLLTLVPARHHLGPPNARRPPKWTKPAHRSLPPAQPPVVRRRPPTTEPLVPDRPPKWPLAPEVTRSQSATEATSCSRIHPLPTSHRSGRPLTGPPIPAEQKAPLGSGGDSHPAGTRRLLWRNRLGSPHRGRNPDGTRRSLPDPPPSPPRGRPRRTAHLPALSAPRGSEAGHTVRLSAARRPQPVRTAPPAARRTPKRAPTERAVEMAPRASPPSGV